MQTPEALRIIGEKLRQMGALDVIGMLSQDPPHITYSPEMDRHTAKTKTCPEPVGAPAPGANGCLPKTLICARRVRGSHRGGAPTAKNQNLPRPRRSTRPGCEWGLPGALICACSGSHRGRCSYNKTKPCQRTRRSTRPGCEWVPTCALSRSR